MKTKVFSVEMTERQWEEFNSALDHMTVCHSRHSKCTDYTSNQSFAVMRFRQKYQIALRDNDPKIITIPTLAD